MTWNILLSIKTASVVTEKNRNNMVLKDNLGELSQDSALDANLETFMAEFKS